MSSNMRVHKFAGIEADQSSAFSPTPTYFTGKPTVLRIATTTPPFAVPSTSRALAPSANRLGKILGLADAVLAGRGIENEDHFVGSVGNLLAEHAVDLGQLLIKLCWVCNRPAVSTMQTSAPVSRRGRPRDGRRLPGRCPIARNDLRSQPFRPNSQLLDGRGAEGIARADTTFSLPGTCTSAWRWCRLAGPVHARHHDHRRPAGGKADRFPGWASMSLSFTLNCSITSSLCTTQSARKFLRTSSAISCAATDAHVRLDEQVEDFLDELLVDKLPFLFEQVADVGIERLPGLFETLFEFIESPVGTWSWELEVRVGESWLTSIF